MNYDNENIYIYIYKKIEYWLHGITIGASRARQLVDIMKYFTGQQDIRRAHNSYYS